MAIYKQTSFEGGTIGNTADETTSGLDNLAGGSGSHPLYVSDGVDGSVALEFNADTTTMYINSPVSTTAYYMRMYIKVVDSEVDNRYVMTVRGGGGKALDVRREGNGTVTIRNVNTAVDSTATGFMPVGEWLRFELFADVTAGTQELRLFKGSNLHGITPDDTLTGACGTISALENMGTITTTATNQQIRVDAFAIGDDWVGPVSGGSSGVDKPKILGRIIPRDL